MRPPDPTIKMTWEVETDFEPEACHVCGAEGHPFYIAIFHRGCRLKQAFPNAYEDKAGVLFFDPRNMLEDAGKVGERGPEQP